MARTWSMIMNFMTQVLDLKSIQQHFMDENNFRNDYNSHTSQFVFENILLKYLSVNTSVFYQTY